MQSVPKWVQLLSVVKFLAENEDKAHEKEMSQRPLSRMQLAFEHPQGLYVVPPAHRTPSRSFTSTKGREKQGVKSNKDGKDQLASNWYKTHTAKETTKSKFIAPVFPTKSRRL